MTLMAGVLTGSAFVWAVGALDAVALVAYVASSSTCVGWPERELKLHYLDPHRDRRADGAGGPPPYVSGRYAHPSNRHAVAR